MSGGLLVGRQTAKHTFYDNSTSGLTARNVQDAIDQIVSGGSGGVEIDAGTTADLTAVIATAVAAGQATIRLRKQDYTWPSGQTIPLGINFIGEGFDGTHSATPGTGTKITSADGTSTTIVQALGSAKATIMRGIYWASPVQIRKQHTVMFGCRTDGLIVGDNSNSCSPYYSQFIAHRFEGQTAGAAIELQNFANACNFDGAIFQPQNGRSIYINSAAVGNTFNVSQDYAVALSNDFGAEVYFANSASQGNIIRFRYWEDGSRTGKFLDGAHIVVGGTSPTKNYVFLPTGAGNLLRVYDPSYKNFVNTVSTKEGSFSSSAQVWTYDIGDQLICSNANIYLPPSTFGRRGPLTACPTVATQTANATWSAASAAVTAAGSGGTDGTYVVELSDANTVTGHPAVFQVTVASGALSGTPTLLYPGINKATHSGAIAVTGVTGLTGGTITITDVVDDIKTPNGQNTFVISDRQVSMFAQDPSNHDWYVLDAAPMAVGSASVSPGANGNATIAHGHTRAPTWADAKILGDIGGTDLHIEIQALDATNITLRFSNAAGTDVTTGGPYTVRWACK